MQKIMVCIKRVVDYNVRIRVKPDGSGVMLDGVKMSVNPFDEIALEEALRIKERGANIEVVAVSIGVADTQQQLRTALGHGRGSRDPGTDRRSRGAADRRANLSGLGQEGKSRSDLPRQASHRRRRQSNRSNAGGDLGAAAGDLRLEGGDLGEQGDGHPRSRCRPRNHRSGPAGGDDRGSALERTALREIAGHHEGQEKAVGCDLARCAGSERRQRCSRP